MKIVFIFYIYYMYIVKSIIECLLVGIIIAFIVYNMGDVNNTEFIVIQLLCFILINIILVKNKMDK